MLIAIDHGNFAIKTVNHSFVAGLAEHTVKPPLTDEVLEFGSKFWKMCIRDRNWGLIRSTNGNAYTHYGEVKNLALPGSDEEGFISYKDLYNL